MIKSTNSNQKRVRKMDIIDFIVIAWLGLMTLRGLVANSGVVPRDKKYSWLIYSKYETELVIQALKAAGITEYDKTLVNRALIDAGIEREDIKGLISKKKFETDYHGINLENLLEIISKYLICHEGKVEYGYKTPIKTTFYISSVEASHDEEYLEWMCILLNSLILQMKEQHSIEYLPDFIVTPKGGNTHFGRTYAEKRHIFFVTSKYSLRSSYVKFLTGTSEYELKTNYEGSWQLLEYQKGRQKDRKLHGIVVDCNTATGEQIVDTMVDFNNLIYKSGINVEPLKYAFTLYRSTDNSLCDVDAKFEEKGFRLFRYFDLSEVVKKLIWEKRGSQDKLGVYLKKDRETIKEILKQIEILA